ncbi:hypothetical protein Tco_1063595 [Tanacetum coccineum]
MKYMQQPMQHPEDILDPTTVIDMALVLMVNAFKLNNTTPTNNNQIRIRVVPGSANIGNLVVQNVGRLQELGCSKCSYNLVVQNVRNQNGLSVVPGSANQNGNGNVTAARDEGNGNGNNENQIRCYNCQGVDQYARNCTVKPRKRDAAYLQT